MPQSLRNVSQIIRLSLRYARGFNHEHGTFHRDGLRLYGDLLDAARRDHHGAISTRVTKKVQWYMAQGLWMASMFEALLGRTFDENERKRFVCAGSLGALSDILIDDMDLAEARMQHIIDDPGGFRSDHAVEHLFQQFYKALVETVPDAETLPDAVVTSRTDLLNKVLTAQLQSKKQLDPTLPTDRVDAIVKAKGALTICAYRGLILEDFGALEYQAMYELGGLIQYINDVDDLYKDGQQGIRSFATARDSLEEMALEIDRQKTVAFRLFKALPYDRTRKENFMFIFYGLVVGTYASLLHYARLCNFNYALDTILRLDKDIVKPNPFTLKAIVYSLPKLLKYTYDRAEHPFGFQPIFSRQAGAR